MAEIISANINLDKIDETKIFQGKNGRYLGIMLLPLKMVDKFGNTHTMVISQSKEEREKGIEATYIGSAKIVGKK